MKIDNEFTVNVPIQRAWEVLTDLQDLEDGAGGMDHPQPGRCLLRPARCQILTAGRP